MKSTAKPRAKSRSTTSAKSARKSDATDWREATAARLRSLILAADPKIVEERKWKKPSNPAGVPTFSRDGIICTLETYKNAVKLTFAHGASLHDPKRLFNASLEGNLRRAIDFAEGESVDATAFKSLIKAAVKRNATAKK